MQIEGIGISHLNVCYSNGSIVYMLRHVTHNYIINFVEGLFPLASEAQSGYDLDEYATI